MEMQMDFHQQFLDPELAVANSSSSVREEEEYKKNKENIPPFSSYSSGSALRLPHPRKPLQDITRLVIRSSPSVAEGRAGPNCSSVRKEEDENKRNKENIPPFSSYSSGSLLRLPHPRKPLQDITRLVMRSSPSVAEARAHVRLGLRSSSKKCSKKKAAVHLSSVGVVSSEERCQIHEMAILRKSFR